MIRAARTIACVNFRHLWNFQLNKGLNCQRKDIFIRGPLGELVFWGILNDDIDGGIHCESERNTNSL